MEYTREPPFLPKNHFKPQDIVFAITLVLIFFQKSAAILNNCDVSWLLYCSDTKSFCAITKRATISRHNYSRWRRPGTLETKINDSIIHVFKVNALC